MNKSYKILAIIPARKGSKGILSKNTKLINNKPLISWTIEAAKRSKYIDKIKISSDCLKVKEIANSYDINIENLRPDHLSTDSSSSDEVILHELKDSKNFDIVCMLQPTSPLRDFEDIDLAFENFFKFKAKALVSVYHNKHSPFWSFKLKNAFLESLFPELDINKRRQDLPETYMLNGAIYISKVNHFKKNQSFLTNQTIAYIMSEDKSIDIDNIDDFLRAEKKLSERLTSRF